MVEIVVEPYRKITVRTYMKYESPEAFIDAITVSMPRGAGARVGSLFWANGVLMRHSNYAPSDALIKEYLAGHLPLDHIEFTLMPQYRSEIRLQDREVTVTILNVSNHTLFDQLTKWVAKNLVK